MKVSLQNTELLKSESRRSFQKITNRKLEVNILIFIKTLFKPFKSFRYRSL